MCRQYRTLALVLARANGQKSMESNHEITTSSICNNDLVLLLRFLRLHGVFIFTSSVDSILEASSVSSRLQAILALSSRHTDRFVFPLWSVVSRIRLVRLHWSGKCLKYLCGQAPRPNCRRQGKRTNTWDAQPTRYASKQKYLTNAAVRSTSQTLQSQLLSSLCFCSTSKAASHSTATRLRSIRVPRLIIQRLFWQESLGTPFTSSDFNPHR